MNCINKGEIKATTGGGMIGALTPSASEDNVIINCTNFGKVEAKSFTGGILADTKNGRGFTTKIINCYNIGSLSGSQYIGEILGQNNQYGTNEITNCYGINRGNPIYNNGVTEVSATNCMLYQKEFMKTQEFLDILNDYVTEYNEGEKIETQTNDLCEWIIDEKTGYPTLNFETE